MNNWQQVFTTYHNLKELEEVAERCEDTELLEEVRKQIGHLLDSYDPTEAERFLKDNYIMV